MVKHQYEGRETELVWSKFLELFNEKYFPEAGRRQKQVDFLNLKQNDMSVAQYESKFAELSRSKGLGRSKKPYTQGQGSNGMSQQNQRICDRCGRSHSVGYNCDGTARICFKFGKLGHLFAQCRSKGLGGQTPGNGTQEKKLAATQGCVFALPREEAEVAPSVVQGTLLISSVPARVLIDFGSTHSFAAPKLLRCLSISCDPLDAYIAVSTPLGETVVLGDVCRSCEKELDG
ncbi:uncharacterized protein LOC114314518 [Camellia sinensis]|uniref:uncharacterized protein LOC114314518 n=1 Tax=Camellia sinensis TaxID=4442 RepID=UPI00103595F6|nr:uncharacterized protein LOC114314518 [Camellia sinensis]